MSQTREETERNAAAELSKRLEKYLGPGVSAKDIQPAIEKLLKLYGDKQPSH